MWYDFYMLTDYFIRNESRIIFGLRLSLGIVFFWFGALKVAGHNPVYDLVRSVSPFLVTPAGNLLLGGLETLIGLGLLLNLFPTVIHMALVLHLAGTFLTFFTAPELMFDPQFPVLSLAGEFVVKNLTLGLAGLTVLAYHYRHGPRGHS